MSRTKSDPPVLRDIAGYTAQIRVHEEQRADLAEHRRIAILLHHQNGVSKAAMARAMGVTETAVTKIIGNGPSRKASRNRSEGS